MTATKPPDTEPTEAGPGWRSTGRPAAVLVCVVACWFGALTATVEAFLTPLYLFGVRFPLAPAAAIVLNPLLVWGTYRLTGRRLAALLPGVAWIVVALVWSGGRREGDVILAANNWVAMAYLLGGTAALAVGAYLVVVRPLQARSHGAPF